MMNKAANAALKAKASSGKERGYWLGYGICHAQMLSQTCGFHNT